jgi:ribosomal protein S18 acetylase RimI-like enzyme
MTDLAVKVRCANPGAVIGAVDLHGAWTGLRKAGPADLDRIAALEAACFGAADGIFSPRQLRDLLNNPNANWLLSLDGKAMGCWLKVGNGRARWARLYSLAVHPALRGQGWGKRLINAGFHWMRAEGLSACRAEVKADNRAARKLYAGCGFQETGLLRDYYAPGVDGVRLSRTSL